MTALWRKGQRFVAVFREAGFARRDFFVCLRAWVDLVLPLLDKKQLHALHNQQIATQDQVAQARAVHRVVDYLARLALRNPPCLNRSRALSRLLHRKSIPHQMLIGWADKAAHAWIEVAGEAIGEGKHATDRYRVLRPLPERARLH